MWNANTFHNLMNIGMVLIAVALAILTSSGCVATTGGGFDCSKSWLNPTVTGYIIAGMSAVKIIVNIGRDGFSGLWKKQPPVSQ